MMTATELESMFSGVIGTEYDTLKLICPLAAKMSQLVGEGVKAYAADYNELSVLELGGGTGITTLAILLASDNTQILSVDSEPTMQNQAKISLAKWQDRGRLCFASEDVLAVLKNTPENSVNIVASAYTLHNFEVSYRTKVITEIYRVLVPDGLFINGDRYGLDDISSHTRLIQQEVMRYFKVLVSMDKVDVLEHWIVHLFADESEDHVMRETASLLELQTAGFKSVQLTLRHEVNALVTAIK